MRGNIEEVCRDERCEQHRCHILDFADATDHIATEREILVNCGVLIRRVSLRREDLPDRRRGAEVDRAVGHQLRTVLRRLIAGRQ